MVLASRALRAGEAAGTEASGWAAWFAGLLVPALVVGVFVYPAVVESTMPLVEALAILGAVALVVILSGHLRLFVLLPLVASYLPSPEAGFGALALTLCYFLLECGGMRSAKPLDALDWAILAVMSWTLLSWLANLGEQTDLFSLPFYTLTFLSPWLLLLVARAAPWTRAELQLVLAIWLALTAVQVAVVLVKPLFVGTPEAYEVPLIPFQLAGVALLRDLAASGASDFSTGTMVSAHHLGAVLVLLGVYVLSLLVLAPSLRRTLGLAVVGYVFLMTDSKHVLVAAVPAGAIYSAAVVWPRLRPAVRRFVLLAALGTLLAGGYQIAATFQRVVVEGVWQPVFALAWLNPKARLFTRTGEQFAKSSLATWIGYGPGAYASRAASIRATDLLFKEQTHLPGLIPPHTAPAYAAVMYDLYTSEIVETARYRSGVLTNPFSSAVGIVGEYGLVGTIVVLVFLIAAGRAGFRIWRRFDLKATWRAAGATAGFGIPFLGGLGFFDSYFEQPDVVVPLMVMLLLGVVAAEGSAVLDNPSPRQGFDRTA